MGGYQTLVRKQREFFQSGKTREVSFRVEMLEKLKRAIQENEKEIMDVLKIDLNKSEFEAYSTEIGIVLEEIGFTLKRLRSWMKPKKVRTPITHFGSSSYIYSEPYGVSLIISPWNYPFQLALVPLIGAISAGNTSIIKPSEYTPETSDFLERLIASLYPEEFVSVIQGGAETSQALLNQNIDYIFFTGSVPVGKIVMEAASKNLTPVTLELGGKSPCIVHEDANLKLAARRIAWGKFTNAGQTCIAPDYVYVHEKIRTEFLEEFKKAVLRLYGEEPLKNENYTHIVSEKHFNRLKMFLEDGETFMGGHIDSTTLAMEPTVLTDISWEDPVMKDEIFGPILPVMEYQDLDEVIDGVYQHPHPLALYLFTAEKNIQSEVLSKISFGGGCINDTVYHFVSPYLPFGGVKSSGIGSYHGKGNFDAFSHKKSIVKQTNLFDIPFRYPTMKNGVKRIKWFLK
ncbi:aldehyde dehydrogenase [Virgibacillus sp. MSP4-1]|uniref:aldehyde dehydrogenase n=1 Tax=Virgibacillus sp. MSP4-1 TaxID=2700081 RepID=UPI0003A3B670|nr:aldehyde dehydrogenase [Virgibacillus sp. MSP4-1]QHS23210.1 aldehyde dehydrogenase [Virgibacillus sp. MSP4-1]